MSTKVLPLTSDFVFKMVWTEKKIEMLAHGNLAKETLDWCLTLWRSANR